MNSIEFLSRDLRWFVRLRLGWDGWFTRGCVEFITLVAFNHANAPVE